MKQNILENWEIPKHKKKTKSNTSKSKSKSKHKHQYEECLIQCDFHFRYTNNISRITWLRSYCTICGKIGGRLKNTIVTDYERTGSILLNGKYKTYRSCISSEELYEKYHDKLPVFFVEDILDRYVIIDENNGE